MMEQKINYQRNNFILAFCVAIIIFLCLWVSLTFEMVTIPAGTAGQPRKADMEIIRKKIIEKNLSDKEAIYYNKTDDLKK